MSHSIKVVVALLVAGLLVSACSALRGIEGDPGKVAAAAARIADFDLPAGYRPEATASVAGYCFVSYAPGDGHSHIQLIQAPQSADVDAATLEQYAQQTAPTSDSGRHQVRTVGQSQATVHGQAVTFVIGEGTNHDGDAYRTWTCVFQGKGGPALLSIEAPISSWDQAAVDAFIASIH